MIARKMEDVYMCKRPLFGVAGFPPNFFSSTYGKSRENIFEWLHEVGLQWIELQNTYGVKMKKEQALRYRALSEKFGIGISIHAPYYINFCSVKPDVVERSRQRMIQCIELAKYLKSTRIIFHPGFSTGKDLEARQKDVQKVVDGLLSIRAYVDGDIHLYPETAGRISQIGSVDEIINICNEVPYAYPCFDMAHIHAFERGAFYNSDAISDKLEYAERNLGEEKFSLMHFHMYPVEIGPYGEKKHKAFDDVYENDGEQTGKFCPRAGDLMASIAKMNMNPVVVCEAYNSQDTGALLMKQDFERICREKAI